MSCVSLIPWLRSVLCPASKICDVMRLTTSRSSEAMAMSCLDFPRSRSFSWEDLCSASAVLLETSINDDRSSGYTFKSSSRVSESKERLFPRICMAASTVVLAREGCLEFPVLLGSSERFIPSANCGASGSLS